MRVRPIWRHGEVGRSSCQVDEAGAVAVTTGGRERAMSRRSTATRKQCQDSGPIRSWSRSDTVNNGGGKSAPIRFTRPPSRQLQQHGVRGTRPSARRQMDSVSGIREEGALLQDGPNATLRSETLQRNCERCHNRKWWCKRTVKKGAKHLRCRMHQTRF